MLSDTGKAAPQRLLDAFTLHEPSLIDAAVATDFTEHSAPPGMPPDREALKAFVQMFITALPDFHFDVELCTEQDDLVMIYGYAEGTLCGPLFGSPATDRHGR